MRWLAKLKFTATEATIHMATSPPTLYLKLDQDQTLENKPNIAIKIQKSVIASAPLSVKNSGCLVHTLNNSSYNKAVMQNFQVLTEARDWGTRGQIGLADFNAACGSPLREAAKWAR